jgi:FkbM family methyltransferase
MISHAQNAEDVVLRRVLGETAEGFYVDVGASDPVEDSVTFYFYERGWRGVNVEPDPDDYQQLATERPRDVNLNAAVGEEEGRVGFYPSPVRGHGTVKAALATDPSDGSAIEVAQIRLDRIFEEHWPPDGVDFLKIDAEGSEAEALASADLRRWRPRVVLVEAVDAAGSPSYESWEPGLLASGYRFALFDGVNRFYYREEDEEELLGRLSSPANVLDNWRPRREVAIQDALQAALDDRQRTLSEERSAHEQTQRALEQAQRALEQAQRALADVQRALADERSAYAEICLALDEERAAHLDTRRVLESVYASTSWRLTSPVRDASRLARLMGWGKAQKTARRPNAE